MTDEMNNEYDGISGFMTQELFLKVTEAVESLLPRICTPGEPTPFRKIVEAILAEPEFADALVDIPTLHKEFLAGDPEDVGQMGNIVWTVLSHSASKTRDASDTITYLPPIVH